MFVATMIAKELTEAQVAAAAELLDEENARSVEEPWRWLDKGRAADVHFASYPVDASALLQAAFPGADIIVQPEAGREKRVLVADMDSTMIQCECIDELADYAGLKPQVAAVTEAAMRGALDFAEALDARVGLLAGLPETVLAQCLAERVRDTPGAATLIRTMRARGARTVLVSGGFTAFAEPVGARLGFQTVIANRLEIADGRLTGKVARPIVTAETKLEALRRAAAEARAAMTESLAIGDGANDLPMIRAAGLGVAYRAKPIVAAAAAARIEHGDLTALLHAQGIPRAAWIET